MKSSEKAGSIALVGLLALWGCSGGPNLEDIEQQNVTIVRETHAALANGDFEAFEEALAPDYKRHCQAMPPPFQELEGTEEFLAFLQEFVEAVPGYQDTITQMIAQGDMVAYVSTMNGVQTGPLGDLPGTGREFTLVNIIIQRLENGKIAETWVSWDNVAFLTQLGHFPAPE